MNSWPRAGPDLLVRRRAGPDGQEGDGDRPIVMVVGGGPGRERNRGEPRAARGNIAGVTRFHDQLAGEAIDSSRIRCLQCPASQFYEIQIAPIPSFVKLRRASRALEVEIDR